MNGRGVGRAAGGGARSPAGLCPGAGRKSHPLGSTFSWGDDLQCQFFCEKEHDCLSLMHALFAAGGGFRFVGNGDRECLNQFAFVRDPIEHMIVSPWHDGDRIESLENFRSTDFNDEMTICGGAAEVRNLAGRPGAGLELVYHSCLPLMIGDTFRPELARGGGDGALPHLVCEMDVHNLYANLQKFWRNVVQYAQSLPGPRRTIPRSVSLIGFGRTGDPDLSDLVFRVRELGISVVAGVLPSFAAGELPRFRRAARHVIVDDEVTENAFLEARKLLARPLDRLPAPYGMDATRRWLIGLGGLFGRERVAARVFEKWQDGARAEWEALKTEAVRHRVALVAGKEQLRSLADPRSHYGVDVVRVLQEMGFGLDVLVFDRSAGAGIPPTAGQGAHGRYTITRFADSPGLQRMLSDGAFSLVYSEIHRDRRVLCAGKLPFNHTAFRKGVSGALASLRFLLSRCDVPFYRDYRRYMGDP